MATIEPRLAVLLGAGASADAGIPTTIKMTDAVIDHVAENRGVDVRVLEFIRHTLAADLAREEPAWRTINEARQRIRPQVDVERLFAAVDLLVDRSEQPWSPFVSTWHPALEAFSPGPRLNDSDLSSELRRFGQGLARGGFAFERSVVDLLEKALRLAQEASIGSLLSDLRQEMLRSLFAILDIDDRSRVSYLTPLAELGGQAEDGLTIATLNYDRSIENAAEIKGVECDTGIEGWVERGNIQLVKDGLRLVKLHGSVDWVVEATWDDLPMQRVRKVRDPDEKSRFEAPAVIFGEAGKLRAEGPYLELLLTWLSELRRANTLLIVGHSFRDTHVNELIARWFNEEPSARRVVVLDLEEIKQTGDDFKARLARVDGWASSTQREPHGFTRFEQVTGLARDELVGAIELALKPRIPDKAS